DHEGTRATTIATPTLGEIVGAYKSLTTVEYIRAVREKGWEPISRRLWQRNYYEHIVRNEIDLQRVRQYILDNPAKWSLDSENPSSQR
ncbi:MAG: transposase, partial [Chloroflexota bacterium]|nr:transposase [Chloroflexota bacterium]